MPANSDVSSREYKVMLDHRLFKERNQAAAHFWRELKCSGRRVKKLAFDGEFDVTKKREIVLLDTLDRSIRHNGYIPRKRYNLEGEGTEYTLKCRSPDRYVARGANVEAENNGEAKFEEDIGPPFVSRYSFSCTVKGPKKAPKNLKQAATIFPVLRNLTHDGENCPIEANLEPPNSVKMFERVLTGPILNFAGEHAEVALILWSDGPDGRPLIAEFSFRYAWRDEQQTSHVSGPAMDFLWQCNDSGAWPRPGQKLNTSISRRNLGETALCVPDCSVRHLIAFLWRSIWHGAI